MVVGVLGVAFIVAGVIAGGPWYFLILVALALWTTFAVRFLMSPRGRTILFSRFDDYEPPRDRGEI